MKIHSASLYGQPRSTIFGILILWQNKNDVNRMKTMHILMLGFLEIYICYGVCINCFVKTHDFMNKLELVKGNTSTKVFCANFHGKVVKSKGHSHGEK